MGSYLSERILRPPLLQTTPSAELGIFVLVPCYDEEDIDPLLQSLKSNQFPGCHVEVLILINEGVDADREVAEVNQRLFKKLQKAVSGEWPEWMQMHCTYIDDMPKKHAGVGLARKIGMDEGYRRFRRVGDAVA